MPSRYWRPLPGPSAIRSPAGFSTNSGPADFRLNPALDLEALGRDFRALGRLQVADFWAAETADAIADWLTGRTDWSLVYNRGDAVVELTPDQLRRTTSRRRRRIAEEAARRATEGFAFCYEAYPVSYRYEAGPGKRAIPGPEVQIQTAAEKPQGSRHGALVSRG